jgi:hypothetical protein
MLPPVDIGYIAAELARLGDEIEGVRDEGPQGTEAQLEVLRSGLDDLLDTLSGAEADTLEASAAALRGLTGKTPEALLDHGLDLISRLSALAGRLHLPQTARGIEGLALPLACWLLRRGAELQRPEPVVNAAAALANGLRDRDELAELYALMREVIDGFSPLRIQETAVSDLTRPWRVVLLDLAIVATRSHRPALMVEAFDLVCEHLPEDAPDFFREGMGQIDAMDYPQPVREIMERYYVLWCAGQRLH